MKVNKRLRHFHDSPTPSEIVNIKILIIRLTYTRTAYIINL